MNRPTTILALAALLIGLGAVYFYRQDAGRRTSSMAIQPRLTGGGSSAAGPLASLAPLDEGAGRESLVGADGTGLQVSGARESLQGKAPLEPLRLVARAIVDENGLGRSVRPVSDGALVYGSLTLWGPAGESRRHELGQVRVGPNGRLEFSLDPGLRGKLGDPRELARAQLSVATHPRALTVEGAILLRSDEMLLGGCELWKSLSGPTIEGDTLDLGELALHGAMRLGHVRIPKGDGLLGSSILISAGPLVRPPMASLSESPGARTVELLDQAGPIAAFSFSYEMRWSVTVKGPDGTVIASGEADRGTDIHPRRH